MTFRNAMMVFLVLGDGWTIPEVATYYRVDRTLVERLVRQHRLNGWVVNEPKIT